VTLRLTFCRELCREQSWSNTADVTIDCGA
jgi:hypothetical protein